ncbi:hypothetical protein GGR52DRAFT_71241 [Hypoxylon sp. FL1284]|nr:hypothetical protein GGR52DRAFT_71241 [Hypoxylon sp. FL1284]
MAPPFATRERRALVSSFREFNKLVAIVPILAASAVSARRRYHLGNIVPRMPTVPRARFAPITTSLPTRHQYPTRVDLPDQSLRAARIGEPMLPPERSVGRLLGVPRHPPSRSGRRDRCRAILGSAPDVDCHCFADLSHLLCLSRCLSPCAHWGSRDNDVALLLFEPPEEHPFGAEHRPRFGVPAVPRGPRPLDPDPEPGPLPPEAGPALAAAVDVAPPLPPLPRQPRRLHRPCHRLRAALRRILSVEDDRRFVRGHALPIRLQRFRHRRPLTPRVSCSNRSLPQKAGC